jgi:hypothetical protein
VFSIWPTARTDKGSLRDGLEMIAESLSLNWAECATKHVKHGISMTVVLSDWRRLDVEFELTEALISPYVYGGRLCVSAALRWLNTTKAKGPMEYVFENGTEDKGKLLDILSLGGGQSDL